MGPRAGVDGRGIFRPHRNSIPDRPARGKSLYRLSFLSPRGKVISTKYSERALGTQHAMCFFFFFLPFSLLIGWQLSIWNCCKPFLSLLYNCQLLCFWRLALSIVVEVFPQALFFPDIAPSRMFITNSLCLIICPIHVWRLFFKIFKSKLSSFALHLSLFYLSILFLTFFSNSMFQMHLRPFLHFFYGPCF